MFRNRIPPRQLCAWLFTGTTPVLIQMLGGEPWLMVVITGAVCVGINLWIWRSNYQPIKWQCPLLYIYTVILIGQLLPFAAQSWPEGNATAVPLMILLLAAWSAQKGPSAAARVGAVLFWLVLILYLAVFGAGTGNISLRWLKPQWKLPNWIGLTVFLVPSAAVCILESNRKNCYALGLPVLFAAVAAAVSAAAMSPEVAYRTPNAFYEMSRSINLLGVARRFEALISAAMTVGWFALISLLLTLCGVVAQNVFEGRGREGVWLGGVAAAAFMLCDLHISGWIMAVLAAVFWVVMPLLTQGLDKIKKS